MPRIVNISVTQRVKDYIKHLAAGGDMMAQLLVEDYGNSISEASGMVGDPTTPNAQITGVGNTSWRVNITAMIANLFGLTVEQKAQVDLVISTGSQLLTLNQSIRAAVVLKQAANGTLSFVVALGVAAADGSELAVTDVAVQTAVGAGLNWMKLADLKLNRNLDTQVTPTYFNVNGDRGLIALNAP